MELWEALEVLAGRVLNFRTDVAVTHDDTDPLGFSSLIWNIPDVSEPTRQEIEDMVELPPLLKIRYNPQGFIAEIRRGVEYIAPSEGTTITTLHHTRPTEPYLDLKTGLPLYRYINGAIVPIADQVEYKESDCLWARYSAAYIDEIKLLLSVKTNDEMRQLYVSSPEYKRELIFTAVQYYWTEKIPHFNATLIIEVMLRLLIEKTYIDTVEQRPFTPDEMASFTYIMSSIRQSNSMLKNDPNEQGANLDLSHWYNLFIPTMSDLSVMLRNHEFNQRSFICAPVQE
jgi:hypothetical protein